MSADLELVCNYKNCRKALTTVAWVTSCSHAFCEDHGLHIAESENRKCASCQSPCQNGTYDLVRIDLKPSEDYKSMVLAGMSPEVILTICTRAMTFWNYQMYQELLYQKSIVKQGNEKLTEMEVQYKNKTAILENEIQRLQNIYKETKEEVKSLTHRIANLNEKIVKDKREYQNLQSYCNTLHRRTIPSSVQNMTTPSRGQQPQGKLDLTKMFSITPQTGSHASCPSTSTAPVPDHYEPFIFQPSKEETFLSPQETKRRKSSHRVFT